MRDKVIIWAVVLFGVCFIVYSVMSDEQHSEQAKSDTSRPESLPVKVTASNLLAEFRQSDEAYQARVKSESLSEALQDTTETAPTRYRNKTIQITGVLTGVFVPSIQNSRQILASRGTGIFDEQGGAGSFITMGGPFPQSVADTLLLPGIHAWSRTDGSLQPLFGQPDLAALYGQLAVGKVVTLSCKFDSYSGSAQELEISLEDCVLVSSPHSDTERLTQPPAPIERTDQLPSAVATSAPVLIYQVEPLYSEEARAKHLGGTVQVRLVITAEGLPTNVQVAKSLGSGLDEAAINAVSQYRFKPARDEAGTAVPVTIYIDVNFQMF